MNKERDILMDDGFETATGIIQNSAQCVAALIDLPPAPESERVVLEDYQIVVIGHALLSFLDARYEEQCPSDGNSETQDSPVENEYCEFYQKWFIAWEKDHPDCSQAERSQAIKAIAWLLANFKFHGD